MHDSIFFNQSKSILLLGLSLNRRAILQLGLNPQPALFDPKTFGEIFAELSVKLIEIIWESFQTAGGDPTPLPPGTTYDELYGVKAPGSLLAGPKYVTAVNSEVRNTKVSFSNTMELELSESELFDSLLTGSLKIGGGDGNAVGTITPKDLMERARKFGLCGGGNNFLCS